MLAAPQEDTAAASITLPGLTPLPALADQINACFKSADKAELKASDKRITAGRLLVAARDRIERGEAGEITFREWCKAQVQRSWPDIRKCIKLAESDDPEAARDAEKAKARAAMKKLRAKRKRDGEGLRSNTAGVSATRSATIDLNPKLVSLRLPGDPPPYGAWDARLGQYLGTLSRAMCVKDEAALKEMYGHPLFARARAFFNA